jgi:membrane-bound inhibitor of C-type lysozyme
MNKLSRFITLFMLVTSVTSPVFAQSPDPVIVNGTIPISTELRDALNAWLATSAPSSAPYYAVTYTQDEGAFIYASLVGLQLETIIDDWTLEDGEAIWMGTVKVYNDGSVELRTLAQKKSNVLALPNVAAGGGSYVAFPWQAGTGMMYGPRGVHGDGDYGTSGMLAVDLVSGTDMGSGAASDRVYASDTGTVDYVCDDGTSVTIRTYNETTDDYFIYAHLLDNAALVIEGEFSKNQQIGTLKRGSFDPPGSNCGWAEQADNHWHLHWMFVPANGSFRAENCILSISSQKWSCGSTVIGTGQFIVGGGGVGTGADDASGLGQAGYGVAPTNISMWDYLIVGIAWVIDPFFKLVPEHQGLTFIQTIYNSAEIVIRLVVVFAYGNINLGPVIAIFMTAIAFQAIMGVLWIISFALKAWKSLVPILGA